MKWFVKNVVVFLIIAVLIAVSLSPQLGMPSGDALVLPLGAVQNPFAPVMMVLGLLLAVPGIFVTVKLIKTMNAKRSGLLLVAVGFASILASGVLLIISGLEERDAANAAVDTVYAFFDFTDPVMVRRPIDIGDDDVGEISEQTHEVLTDPEEDLKYILLDGTGYVAVLSIPALDLVLPVNAAWSYPELRNTPCRYSGSIEEDSLVVMAHGYRAHFGTIERLREGDAIELIDVERVVHDYPFIQYMYLTDNAGKLIASVITDPTYKERYGKLPLGYDFSQRQWFIKPMQSGALHVTDLYQSQFTEKLILTVAAPVTDDDDNITGIIGADIQLEELLKRDDMGHKEKDEIL